MICCCCPWMFTEARLAVEARVDCRRRWMRGLDSRVAVCSMVGARRVAGEAWGLYRLGARHRGSGAVGGTARSIRTEGACCCIGSAAPGVTAPFHEGGFCLAPVLPASRCGRVSNRAARSNLSCLNSHSGPQVKCRQASPTSAPAHADSSPGTRFFGTSGVRGISHSPTPPQAAPTLVAAWGTCACEPSSRQSRWRAPPS